MLGKRPMSRENRARRAGINTELCDGTSYHYRTADKAEAD